MVVSYFFWILMKLKYLYSFFLWNYLCFPAGLCPSWDLSWITFIGIESLLAKISSSLPRVWKPAVGRAPGAATLWRPPLKWWLAGLAADGLLPAAEGNPAKELLGWKRKIIIIIFTMNYLYLNPNHVQQHLALFVNLDMLELSNFAWWFL